MTKNNSLIGLTEFLIPFQIIQNHETKFQKICNVTMTDNTKRTIFNSNNLSNNIKINVEANLNYENEKKDLKIHSKNSSSTNQINKDSNNNNDNNEKEENNIKKRDVHTPTNSKLKKKLNNPKVQSPNVLSANSTNNTTKIIKNSSAKKIKNNNNNINKKPSNKSKSNKNNNNENNNNEINNENNNKNNENNFQDTSQIDSILLKEPQKIDEKFTNFFKKLQENNPLEKLYSFQNDSKLFKNYTTKII